MAKIAYTVGGHLATLYNHTTAVGTTAHTDYNGQFRLYKHSNVIDNTVNTALYLDTMSVITGTMPYTGWTTTSFDYTNSVIQSNTNKAVGSFKPYTALQDEEHKGVVSVTLPETETYLYTWLPNTALNNTSSAFSARMQYSVSGNSEYALDVLSFTAPTHWSDTLYAYNKPKLNLSYTNIGILQNIYMPSNAILYIGGTNVGYSDFYSQYYYYDSDYQDISADNVTANIVQYAIGSGATQYVAKYPTYHHINNSTISFTCNNTPTVWNIWGDFTCISSFNNSNITASAFTANNAHDSNFVISNGDPNDMPSHLVFENGVIDNCTFDCSDANTHSVYFKNCTVTNVTALSDNVVFRYQ